LSPRRFTQTSATIFRGRINMLGKKRVDFGLNRMRQNLAGPLAQHVGQQIIEIPLAGAG
jgi:hypothetical protein